MLRGIHIYNRLPFSSIPRVKSPKNARSYFKIGSFQGIHVTGHHICSIKNKHAAGQTVPGRYGSISHTLFWGTSSFFEVVMTVNCWSRTELGMLGKTFCQSIDSLSHKAQELRSNHAIKHQNESSYFHLATSLGFKHEALLIREMYRFHTCIILMQSEIDRQVSSSLHHMTAHAYMLACEALGLKTCCIWFQ